VPSIILLPKIENRGRKKKYFRVAYNGKMLIISSCMKIGELI
jgi:hypothetical protein